MKSIFVYNPESGRGKIKKHLSYILSELNSANKFGEITVVETDHAGHAHDLAKESIGKYDYFFVSGGDGTLNEIVNGFADAENKPIVGYIPSGTVNDIARSLGISRNIKKAVNQIVNGEPFEHDTFKVNNKYGIYVCATGLFTKSSYDTERYKKKKFGKLAYFVKGIKEIKSTKPLPVTLATEDETIKKNTGLILILNSRSVAGFKLNKQASLCDGEVEVMLFQSHKKFISLFDMIRISNAFLFGINHLKKNKNKFVTYRLLSHFTLQTSDGTAINLDGEKSGEGSFDFMVLNKSLKIIVPRK